MTKGIISYAVRKILSGLQIKGDEIDRTLELHGENHKNIRTSGPKLEGKSTEDS
jgi:hypothetical protein